MRLIPKVDALCAHPLLAPHTGFALTEAIRELLGQLRGRILSGEADEIPSMDSLAASALALLCRGRQPHLRRVYNATGVVLHTNLGRACLSQRAVEQVANAAAGYSTLEYDLEQGERGSRHAHVEGLLCRITGAEAAMAVNNNAAAVLLILGTLARGSEVVISRGELVEIGGSFRVPDVMSESGAILREVGTTNKTHLSDYRSAIGPQTGALLKVHTSNYRIVGFTESVEVEALAKLGREASIPVIEDLGSGALYPLAKLGITDEPEVRASLAAGADLVCFSGDKLLGGPQAGIIVGRRDLVEAVKRHPLARAMRIDKLSLAALEGTLYSYLDEQTARKEIPVISMLSAGSEALFDRAKALCEQLGTVEGCRFEVVQDFGQVGGGSVPHQQLLSWAVAVTPNCSVGQLEERLRRGTVPVVGHIAQNRLLLNVLTLFDQDLSLVAQALIDALTGEENQ